jgi:hypothetical protein
MLVRLGQQYVDEMSVDELSKRRWESKIKFFLLFLFTLVWISIVKEICTYVPIYTFTVQAGFQNSGQVLGPTMNIKTPLSAYFYLRVEQTPTLRVKIRTKFRTKIRIKLITKFRTKIRIKFRRTLRTDFRTKHFRIKLRTNFQTNFRRKHFRIKLRTNFRINFRTKHFRTKIRTIARSPQLAFVETFVTSGFLREKKIEKKICWKGGVAT